MAIAPLPLSEAGDPERHCDEFYIEPETRALQVQAIETEFASKIEQRFRGAVDVVTQTAAASEGL